MITTTSRWFGASLTSIALLGWPVAGHAQGLPPLLEIAAEPGNQDDPATAYNPFNLSFLVVWDQSPIDAIESAINGRFVTPRLPLRNGEVHLGDIFTISDNRGAQVDEPALSVSKSGNVLVTGLQVVGEPGSEFEAPFATLLDRKGRTIKDPFRIDPNTNCDLGTVSPAYNSRRNQWLVVWDRDDGSDPDCADTGVSRV